MGWRDVRGAAREDVHETFTVFARYVAAVPYDSNSGASAPQISVRIHDSQKPLGTDPGDRKAHAAVFVEAVPRAIFWRQNLEDEGVTLARNAVISISADEAYQIDAVLPHDIETIACHVHRLSGDDLTGLPLPAEDA